MSMELIKATVPFLYVRNYRYYQGAKIVSYLLGSFIPMLLYLHFNAQSFRLSDIILAWLIFWTFYEIGYLYNDCRSAATESKPTHRVPSTVMHRFHWIVGFRCVLLVAEFLAAAWFTEIDMLRLTALVAVTGAVFSLHNALENYQYRFVTLVMLSVLQPAFVPYVNNVEFTPLVFLLLPFLILKYLEYLYYKGFLTIDFRANLPLRCCLFTAWVFPVIALGPEALCVYAFIYLNHTKRFFWEKLTSTAAADRVR